MRKRIAYVASLTSRRFSIFLVEPSVITFAQHPLSIIRPQDVPQQLVTVDERIEMLQKCGTQTCIMLDFDHQLRQLTARQFLEMIGRDYGVRMLIIGFNTRFGCDCVDSFEEYQRLGKEVGVEVIQATENALLCHTQYARQKAK